MNKMKKSPLLYTFRRCPYAIRARMALILNKIEVEYHEVSLKNKPEAMLKVSPKGTVPVLVLEEKVIDESIDIIYWAFEMNHNQEFLHNEKDTRQFVLQYDYLFKTILTYYKYSNVYPEKSMEEYRDDCESFTRDFEERLREHTFLFSDKMEIADICIYPFIRQLSKVDESWFEQALYPHLKKWKAFFDTSDFFLAAMQKRK